VSRHRLWPQMHFPIPKAALQLLHTLKAAGHEAFLVGGCVRDLLRGKAPGDYDLATRARPEEVRACFRKVIPTGIQHGTVTVLLGGMSFEVTTYRSEGDYVDGRRPLAVHFESSIEEDLSRRDFTINAMAYNPLENCWVDPFGGKVDLQKGCVRCVGDALQRFSEDGLRAIRAIRFATTLNFELEENTQKAIPQRLNVFAKIAIERIREEFLKLLAAPQAQRGMELLLHTGLLEIFLPEAMHADFATATRPAQLLPRLALLLMKTPNPQTVLQRLKFSNKTTATVLQLIEAQPLPPPHANDACLRRWLSQTKLPHWKEALATGEALEAREESLAQRIEALLAQNPALSVDKLALRGKEIGLILGSRPGPHIGKASRFLLKKVLENPSLNSKEALSQLLRNWNK